MNVAYLSLLVCIVPEKEDRLHAFVALQPVLSQKKSCIAWINASIVRQAELVP